MGKYYAFALRAMSDILLTLLVPALFAAFLGKWLDARLATARLFFFGLLAVALALSAVVLVRKVTRYAASFQKLISSEHERVDSSRR